MAKQLRYVEISARNPITKMMLSGTCGDVCITIRRAGADSCTPPPTFDSCSNTCVKPRCELDVATVCALEVDDDGYTVFEWPKNLHNELREGWYTGIIMNGCANCGEIPVRVGPRCNVVEVETEIFGPDSACWIGCDDDCPQEQICPTTSTGTKTAYVPSY